MFAEKKIKVEIDYNDTNFSAGQTMVFENLPVHIKCTFIGLPSGNKSVIKIYGVSKEHMDKITIIKFKQALITTRKIRLFVDDGKGYELLYEGYIISAVPVYDSAPNVYIQIESSVGAFPNAESSSSNVFSVRTPAFQVFREICNTYDFDCEEVFWGAVRNYLDKTMIYDQKGLNARLAQAEKDYNCWCVYKKGKYILYPKDKEGRASGLRKYQFSPSNYIGYPYFTDTGIILRTDVMTDINLMDLFQVSGSEVNAANDVWQVWKIDYDLQTLTPSGHWSIILYGNRYQESK